MKSLPSVSLGNFQNGTPAEQQRIAAEVDTICKEIGFLIVEDHGVPGQVIAATWEACRSFFEMPADQKQLSQAPEAGCPRGYFPLAAETLAKSLGVETPPDIKESFAVGPLRAPSGGISEDEFEFHFGANYWPVQPLDFQETLTTYFKELEALGSRMLRLFAAALELPHNYFEQFHTHPMCALRCLNYPAVDGELLPDQRGAGAHADYGSITILKSDPRVAGLEVLLPDGSWMAAPLLNDAFIVNIGDMMARWTNDRWVSTLHRVASPTQAQRRQSIAFFHNANFDANIDCIPTCRGERATTYESVLAGRYLSERFRAALNAADD